MSPYCVVVRNSETGHYEVLAAGLGTDKYRPNKVIKIVKRSLLYNRDTVLAVYDLLRDEHTDADNIWSVVDCLDNCVARVPSQSEGLKKSMEDYCKRSNIFEIHKCVGG